MANDLVLRCQWEAYMDCGVAGTPDLKLIGEGFTSFPEAKNPKEYSRKYVNHKTESSDVIGYSPSIEYSCDCISDDPVVQEIIKIHEGEFLGNETHRDIISVNRWEKGPTYKLTKDTTLSAGKTYYERTGTAPNYTYTAVTEPDVAEIATYYEVDLAEGSCIAYKRTYAIIPNTKGDGTDALIYSGTMKAASDQTKGTFAVSTKTFTADT